jgi:anti-sigma B factor antagonist
MFSVDLSTRIGDGHVVVGLRGELDLADAAAVSAALGGIAAGEPDIIVDLAALEFIDSNGVAALAHGRKQARRAGGDLLLAAPGPRVLRVLTITWLIDALPVYTSVAEAARARRSLAPAGPAAAAREGGSVNTYRLTSVARTSRRPDRAAGRSDGLG